MKTPVSKASLKQHLTYYWWLYVAIAFASVLGINLLYTMTAYRVPDERKLVVIVYGYTNPDVLDGYLESVRTNELSGIEEIVPEQIIPDDTNGISALSTKVYAREGDIFVLPRDTFVNYSESGILMPLEGDTDLLSVLGDEVDATRGWRTLSGSDDTHLFGIPMDQLPGLQSCIVANRGFVCIPASSPNPENARALLRIICRDMQIPPETDDSGETEAASPSPETP